MPSRVQLPKPLAWAGLDAGLIVALWVGFHQLRFGVEPEISKGPLIVFPLGFSAVVAWRLCRPCPPHPDGSRPLQPVPSACIAVVLILVVSYVVSGLSWMHPLAAAS